VDLNNILTIDLEDWYQLIYRRITGHLPTAVDHVYRQVEPVLDLLEEHHTKATFFTTGALAQQCPDLVRKVSARGHEIACHGYAHVTLNRLSRKEFEEDTRQAKELLEDITGKQICGYRAAEFSVRKNTLWGLAVLAELGFEYDSSIVPMHHLRYGIADFSSQIARYNLSNGLAIIEIPLTTVSFARMKFPIAVGGGYFRLMPYWFTRYTVKQLNVSRIPIIAYFHPYEFDPEPLDIFRSYQLNGWKERMRGIQLNIHQNLGRKTVPKKLNRLLKEIRFTTCQDFLDRIETIKDQYLEY